MAANNWKHGKYIPMAMVNCGGHLVWGNPAKIGEYRCTKCGQIHRSADDWRT